MDEDIRAIHEKLDINNERLERFERVGIKRDHDEKLERFERVGTKRDHDLGFASKEITKRMVWQLILWVVAGFVVVLVVARMLSFNVNLFF